MIRVYQFGCRAPHEAAELVQAQMRAAHDYQNDHVAIERGRRHALRALLDTPEIREAEELLRAATKSSRKAAKLTLGKLRRATLAERQVECNAIAERDETIRRDARALTSAYWGSYLGVEASAQQTRAMPLYEDDGLTPSDPRFVRWGGSAQIGVQLQGGLSTADAHAGDDTRVRLIRGPHPRGAELWLRVGSDGRAPVWAKCAVILHRAMPDAATWKWVRLSMRRQNRSLTRWSVEITIEIPGCRPRSLDTSLTGTIAIEPVWWMAGEETLRVANWRDDSGQSGHILLPKRIVGGLRKCEAMRSVRDTMRADMAKRLERALRESHDALPAWLADARDTMQYWKSPERFQRLVERWRGEKCDAAREAYDLLQAWELRENHLYEYETGARGGALRYRRDVYRNLAAQWSRQYARVILDDRNLSREARWGEDSDLRFLAAPSELRTCVEHAFGRDAVSAYPHREELGEEDEREWCERALDAQKAGIAREDKKRKRIVHGEGGAWASRKAKAAAKRAAE